MPLTHDRPTLTERLRHGFLVFVSSVTCGYGFFYAYYVGRVARGFSGKTDIIGYPAFFNYNNYALFYGYLLGLFAAVGALLILIRYVKLQQFDYFLPRLSPIALTSLIIAFTLILKSSGTWYGWAIVSFVLLTFLKIGACRIDSQRLVSRKPPYAECALSFVLAASVPVLLFSISQNTGWRATAGNQVVVHLRWFPTPILIAAELVVLALGFSQLKNEDGGQLFDKYFVRFILIPALMYSQLASLPGTTTVDDFHTGERLAPLALGLRGFWPWRDFLFIHGIWDDFLQLYIPARLWEATPRTGWAGTPLLFAPIYWICFYLFFLFVFEFSVLPVLTAFFLMISLTFPDPFRFILYPIILLCLYKACGSKRALLWVFLIVLCGVQVLLAPEFALLALCFGFVVILRDLLKRDSKQPWARQFRPTLICGVSAAVFIVLAAGLLSAWDLLDGFLMMAVQLARGHLQTGGIPVQTLPSLLWVTGIPLLFIVGATFVFARALLHSRRQVPAVVWLLWALTLCTVIYYPKYIGRPDGHIDEVIAVAQPGIALLIVFLLGQTRQSLQAHYRPWVSTAVATVFLGLVVLYGFPVRYNPFPLPSPGEAHAGQPLRWYEYVVDSAGSFRGRFITTNQNTDFASLTTRSSNFTTDATTAVKAAALRRFFDAHLHPGDAVFDFSDSPTTFFAILQLKPASRFIHVSLAIQEELQREVVKDLERSRPPYAIYHSDGGLNGWDGIPNEVRHYVIARYVNLHYVYDRTIEGSVIFRRADLPGELQDDGGAVSISACDLGFTPNIFAPRTQPHEREDAALSQPTMTSYLQLAGWATVPEGDARPQIVVRWNDAVLDRFQPSFARPDVDKALGLTLGPTGFGRRIALPNTAITAKDIDITAGSATTGKFVHLGEGAVRGQLDSKAIGAMQTISLASPHGERPSYLSLQFADDPGQEPQQFLITSPNSEEASITFTKIARDRELMLPLGGCYAWGAISKSAPQIGASKPFTLKSAAYYYE